MNSNTVLIITNILTAITAIIISYLNYKKVQRIEITINGRITQLLDAEARAAKAEGELALAKKMAGIGQ